FEHISRHGHWTMSKYVHVQEICVDSVCVRHWILVHHYCEASEFEPSYYCLAF
ncbi:8159_t:CDS:1, partial [Cetraspora pellucida]